MTYNIRDDNGTLLGTVSADPNNGDLVIEHAQSGEQARLNSDGLDVSAVSTKDISITDVGASVERSTNQTISTSTWTKIQFDTVVYDDASEWDGANYRFVPNDDGKYQVTLFAFNNGAGTPTECAIYINGTRDRTFPEFNSQGHMLAQRTFELNAGDTVEGYTYHEYGSDRNLNDAYMTVEVVG